jgi:hypothetical protein
VPRVNDKRTDPVTGERKRAPRRSGTEPGSSRLEPACWRSHPGEQPHAPRRPCAIHGRRAHQRRTHPLGAGDRRPPDALGARPRHHAVMGRRRDRSHRSMSDQPPGVDLSGRVTLLRPGRPCAHAGAVRSARSAEAALAGGVSVGLLLSSECRTGTPSPWTSHGLACGRSQRSSGSPGPGSGGRARPPSGAPAHDRPRPSPATIPLTTDTAPTLDVPRTARRTLLLHAGDTELEHIGSPRTRKPPDIVLPARIPDFLRRGGAAPRAGDRLSSTGGCGERTIRRSRPRGRRRHRNRGQALVWPRRS